MVNHISAGVHEQQLNAPCDFPLKPPNICHPGVSVTSVSTASGSALSLQSLGGSFAIPGSADTAGCTTPASCSYPSNASGSARSADGSITAAKSNWGSSSAHTVLKHQYIAVLPTGTPSSSLGIPQAAVATTDCSPAWAQYQTSCTAGSCTPLYCSLTPTPTALCHGGTPLEEGQLRGESSGSSCQETPKKEQQEEAAEAATGTAAVAGGRAHRSSLLLQERPLQVASLPEEVQQALKESHDLAAEAAAAEQQPHLALPDWFDPLAGCIRRECLPELPSYRQTLNTSVARLSVASRVHHRVRWPGEPAKITAAVSSAAAAAGGPAGLGARRVPPLNPGLLRRKSDSAALLSYSHSSIGSAEGTADTPVAAAAAAAAGVGAGVAARHRRVRFATVASAREFRDSTPSPAVTAEAVASGCGAFYNTGLYHVHTSLQQQQADTSAATAEADMTPKELLQKTAECRSVLVLKLMKQMIEQLVNLSSPQCSEDAKVLQESLQLLRSFSLECSGRLPALCFLGDALTNCGKLIEEKLQTNEEQQLIQLVDKTKQPLLSRDAVMRLHRMRMQMRHTPELELFLTPLETLQVRP
ncbi:hypothetical protein ENH_00064620 [Eimeria necatrix]|uniref:Uncharacterized protein n=1 Tax=Eimeria necatrix TaxID=51315 RepID=U6MYY4_9EIME|nr:hypothetical protein ENH_00064620 [Eimeria necatrix]CDJ69161.1 hypothetical protein ENH_00064620 [Eimeria necatrix]